MGKTATGTKQRAKPVRRQKTRRQKAVDAADRWFSLYIRQRDGNRSVTSNCTRNLTCSHLFSRRFYATRWDETNAYCQTAGENLYHNRDAGPLTSYFLDVHGEEAYRKLYEKARSGAKFRTEEIEDIAAYYKSRFERLTQKQRDFFNVI
ncbi:hypothetical protein [Sediminispirochaeta smaragdinae]|uniref:Uncharacterized protein n=1 Tax=Sediminispirochaeta smaragdinae (strain DSM 11293 / JCM 15392 / SEBR 4228) TaxID=573413 RepID=E1R209_SEDSS|nr:hypothetical protein [Sediminispirochaeta smaragdinae]ADK81894.1 hypothetical protein Spirs_2791 [Sediminispirochaeta smaragdinae DSM 11293]